MSPRAAWRLESMGFREVYDYHAGKIDWLAAGLPTEGSEAGSPRAGTVARTDVPTCRLEERVGDVRQRVHAAGWDACVAVNEQGVVLGVLGTGGVDRDEEARVEEAMRPGPSTFRPHVPITEMAEFMGRHAAERALVTTSDGRLVGILLREDAEAAAHDLHERLHGGGDEQGH